MNGPEDCGKRQGDNRGFAADSVNVWELEGMLSGEKTLDCSSPAAVGPVTYHHAVTNDLHSFARRQP